MRVVRHYAHVPLGGVILLLLIAVIAWLLERRVDGVWDPALRIAAPVPTAVTIAPGPPEPPATRGPAEASEPPAAPPEKPAPSPSGDEPARMAVGPPQPVQQFVLESGPFTSSEAADRLEDQLNRLGYPTIRFRTQKVLRLYVVAAMGFASTLEARRAADEIGGGTVLEVDGEAEVLLDRVPTLGEAITIARPVRARGFEVRVDEDIGPAAIYHVRYGQFESHAAAETRSEALALLGVQSRVVKIK